MELDKETVFRLLFLTYVQVYKGKAILVTGRGGP
jgi:hypothetical protein